MTKVYHNQTFIFGFSYNHYQKLENNTTGTQGSFGFANDARLPQRSASTQLRSEEAQGFANFLTGNANSGFSQLSRDPVTDIKFALYEGFAQDNWKATPPTHAEHRCALCILRPAVGCELLLSNFDPEHVQRIEGSDHCHDRTDLLHLPVQPNRQQRRAADDPNPQRRLRRHQLHQRHDLQRP